MPVPLEHVSDRFFFYFPSLRQLELIELVASLAKARNDLKDRQAKLRKSEGDLAALRTELETETRTREERTEGAASSRPSFPLLRFQWLIRRSFSRFS